MQTLKSEIKISPLIANWRHHGVRQCKSWIVSRHFLWNHSQLCADTWCGISSFARHVAATQLSPGCLMSRRRVRARPTDRLLSACCCRWGSVVAPAAGSPPCHWLFSTWWIFLKVGLTPSSTHPTLLFSSHFVPHVRRMVTVTNRS